MRRALLLLCAAACGGAPATKAPLVAPAPVRAVTPGDALLALLPEGADAVAEIDVTRLRDNAAVGAVVSALRKRALGGFDPLGTLDVAVAAVYRLGAKDAATVFVVRGDVGALPAEVRAGGDLLDEHTFLYGPPAERARVQAGGPRLADDPKFLALRAQAMPAKASGSVVRLTARLAPNARVVAAGKLGVDEVPATISAWLDLADDAALVALLGGDDESDAVRLAELVRGAGPRLERALPTWIPHGRVSGDVKTETAGRTCRVVWLLGPRRLGEWARATARRLEAGGDT